MLILRNIKRNDNIISADYYPEGEPEFGHIVIDLNTQEIVSLKKPKGYEYSTDGYHAKLELLRIAKSGRIPEERTVLWY